MKNFAELMMLSYMKNHEHYVKEILQQNPDAEKRRELLAYHDKQIKWMQHERLVHLIVMLFVCFFTLIIFGFAAIRPSLPAIALFVILLILSVAYIFHYFRLENSVQKWYLISNEIRPKR
ncbi:MAG TPA: hypothetical protein PKJ10_03385 [Smithella sp.]|nr:hypothetical protein [Smithella sp.]